MLDGLTGDQRFYLGWAQVWRRKYREANLLQRLLTDPHSPSEQRVAVVRNLDPWYAAFRPDAGRRALSSRPSGGSASGRMASAADLAGPPAQAGLGLPALLFGLAATRLGRRCCSGRSATRSSPAPSSPG